MKPGLRKTGRWTGVAVGLVVAGAIFVWGIFPLLVHGLVAIVLSRVGLEGPKFSVRSASLWHADLVDLRAARAGIEVGSVRADFSPWGVLRGTLRTVRIDDAVLRIPPEAFSRRGDAEPGSSPLDMTPAAIRLDPAMLELPVDRLEFRHATVVWEGAGSDLQIPVNATLARGDDGRVEVRVESEVGGGQISLHARPETSDDALIVTVKAQRIGLSGLLRRLAGENGGSWSRFDGFVSMEGQQRIQDGQVSGSIEVTLEDGSFRPGKDLGISADGLSGRGTVAQWYPFRVQNVELGAETVNLWGERVETVSLQGSWDGRSGVKVGELSGRWAEGKVALPDGVEVASDFSRFEGRVAVEQISLNDVLRVVTGGRSSGEGFVSGEVPVTIMLEGRAARLRIGEGSLAAVGGGVLRLGDATADLGRLMSQSDPRYSSDLGMQALQKQVLEALADFRFEQLSVVFRRSEDDLIVATTAEGRGNSGSRQPLKIEQNYRGLEDALNYYLSRNWGVMESATGSVPPAEERR
jgi:hypothetical protein